MCSIHTHREICMHTHTSFYRSTDLIHSDHQSYCFIYFACCPAEVYSCQGSASLILCSMTKWKNLLETCSTQAHKHRREYLANTLLLGGEGTSVLMRAIDYLPMPEPLNQMCCFQEASYKHVHSLYNFNLLFKLLHWNESS